MKKYKIYITCKGCDKRLLEATKINRYFDLNGCKITNNPSKADYIVFNTCAFSQLQEDECFNLMHDFVKHKAELIILGCLPALASTRFKNVFHGKYLYTKQLSQIDQFFPHFKIKFDSIQDAHILHQDLSNFQKFKSKFSWSWDFFLICWVALKFKLKNFKTPLHRSIRKGAYLRISGGCFNKCSYCAIPNAIGQLKSKNLDLCLNEYQELLAQGHKTIIITADNVGSYGIDIQSNFVELLEAMAQIDQGKNVNWIISELHPQWLLRYKEGLLKLVRNGKITELLCPIQSASERVLKLMKREHNIKAIEEVFIELKEANPHFKLNTDIIIGFPSETKEEFTQSIEFVKRVRFDQVQLFKYTDRPGTSASQLTDKISNKDQLVRLRLAIKILKGTSIGYLYQ